MLVVRGRTTPASRRPHPQIETKNPAQRDRKGQGQGRGNLFLFTQSRRRGVRFFPCALFVYLFFIEPTFSAFFLESLSLSSPGLIEARTGREVQYKVRPNSVLSSERKQAGPPACGSTYIRLCLSRHPPRHAEERARTVAGHLQVAKRIRHAAHEAPAGRRAVAQDLAPRSPQMEPSPSLVAERRA